MTVCLINVGHLERERTEGAQKESKRERERDGERAEGKLEEILSRQRRSVSNIVKLQIIHLHVNSTRERKVTAKQRSSQIPVLEF